MTAWNLKLLQVDLNKITEVILIFESYRVMLTMKLIA